MQVDYPPIADLAHDLLRDDDLVDVPGVGDDHMASLPVSRLGEIEDEDVLMHGAGEATHGDQRVTVY